MMWYVCVVVIQGLLLSSACAWVHMMMTVVTPVSVVRQGLLLSSACAGWDDDDVVCVCSSEKVLLLSSACVGWDDDVCSPCLVVRRGYYCRQRVQGGMMMMWYVCVVVRRCHYCRPSVCRVG